MLDFFPKIRRAFFNSKPAWNRTSTLNHCQPRVNIRLVSNYSLPSTRKHANAGNVPLARNAGKQETAAENVKTWNWWQARENMKRLPRAGKHVTAAKRGKIRNWCQARENMYLLPSARKHVTAGKRAKTSNFCWSWENRKPLRSAGRHIIAAKYGKNVTAAKCENAQVVLSVVQSCICCKARDIKSRFWCWICSSSFSTSVKEDPLGKSYRDLLF